MSTFRIASDHLSASILAKGAELCRLQTGTGQDLLWSGDPAVWGRTAPVLFPVVGALQDDTLIHEGQSYPMTRHGFARDLDWTLVRQSGHALTLRLTDTPGTRAAYPFPFALHLTFTVDGPALRVRYDLHNPGTAPLPASMGAHPAFLWPLAPGAARDAHWLEFEKPEPDPQPGLDAQGLLTDEHRPSPVQGRFLPLHDGLFGADALLFLPAHSRAVRYSAPGAPILEVSWHGFPDLGVWTRPGAPFLCLEPWRGFASPAGFRGEFADKPGVFLVAPGDTASASYGVRVLP